MEQQANEAQATSAPVKAATTKPAKTKATKAKKPAKAAKGKSKKAKGKTDGVKGPGVLRTYAPTYHKDKEVKTAGGHVSVDNNDKTAKDLRGKSLDDAFKMAAKILKEPEADLRKKYKHLNPGMQRMNLGNRIRAAI